MADQEKLIAGIKKFVNYIMGITHEMNTAIDIMKEMKVNLDMLLITKPPTTDDIRDLVAEYGQHSHNEARDANMKLLFDNTKKLLESVSEKNPYSLGTKFVKERLKQFAPHHDVITSKASQGTLKLAGWWYKTPEFDFTDSKFTESKEVEIEFRNTRLEEISTLQNFHRNTMGEIAGRRLTAFTVLTYIYTGTDVEEDSEEHSRRVFEDEDYEPRVYYKGSFYVR